MPYSYPTVSVIIPTYNRMGYLAQAIQSVLSQTLTDYEIIVDDGSTDDTAAAVSGFRDAHIRYLRQSNAGRSVARNLGLAHACGKYIAFLDDDDRFLPHKLACQSAYLETHVDTGLVASGVRLIASDGAVMREWHPWHDQPELVLPACLYACPMASCGILMRRECLGLVDHWFDPDLDRAEDTDLWLRLLVAGCRMDWLPEVVSDYRQHEGSSQHDSDRYYYAFLQVLDKFFACPSLSPGLRGERPRVYAVRHTHGACQAFLESDVAEMQSRLLEAYRLQSISAEDLAAVITDNIANFARSQADGHIFVKRLFACLPEALASLRPYRRRALSNLYMGRVFEAQTSGTQPRLRDWVWGIAYGPRWLWNLGVWSVLIRGCLFPTTPHKEAPRCM